MLSEPCWISLANHRTYDQTVRASSHAIDTQTEPGTGWPAEADIVYGVGRVQRTSKLVRVR
jgi:hypothetical protein